MKRAALYVRVSTQEQKINGMSVDSQIDALTKYCDENGYSIAGIYEDGGISARKKYTGRPALLKLINDCQLGKVDILLVTKLDRFFRSVPDYYSVMEQLNGIPWKAIWEDYETETSSGVFKVNIMLSIAQAESDRTSERIKKVFEYKREQGGYVGSAPTGYKVIGRDLVIDESKKAAVKAFFDEFAMSYSRSKAMRAAAAEGLPLRLRGATIMLRNKTYSGDANGYQCEPYITPEQYEKNLKCMEPKTRPPKNPDRVYIFSGMVRCGSCGRRMVGKEYKKKQKSGHVSITKFYYCAYSGEANSNHSYTCLAESKIQKFMINHYNDALTEAHERYTALTAPEDIDRVKKQKQQLNARLQRIGDRYEDGDISREEYRAKRDEIKRALSELDQEETGSLPAILPDNWLDIYNDLSPHGKQSFWRGTMSEIVITRKEDGTKDLKIVF